MGSNNRVVSVELASNALRIVVSNLEQLCLSLKLADTIVVATINDPSGDYIHFGDCCDRLYKDGLFRIAALEHSVDTLIQCHNKKPALDPDCAELLSSISLKLSELGAVIECLSQDIHISNALSEKPLDHSENPILDRLLRKYGNAN